MRRAAGAAARGVTLIELLVVMMVIAVLLGLGVGAFSGLHLGYRGDAAIERVKSCLRRTRTFAVAERTTARVAFDAARGSVTGAGLAPVALFHLEDETGAFDRTLSLAKAALAPDGRFGSGLRLAPGVECGTDGRPSDADPSGVAAELWVRPESTSGGTLLSLGSSWRLYLGAGNVPGAEVETSEGVITVDGAEDDALALNRFARVGFVHDRESLRLLVDGAEIASEPAPGALRRDRAATLRIGSGGEPFAGVVDEVKVHAVSGRETVTLPPDVAIVSAPPSIQFDATGRLDPAVHAGGVEVEFTIAPSERRALVVSLLGTASVEDRSSAEAGTAGKGNTTSTATGGLPR
jgi:prepilin-type N-terminal cleavage/methylation domain-containing protein